MTSPQVEKTQSVFREVHLRDYWKVVWQGRWSLMAVFLVVVGATAVWTFMQPAVYRATATIEVQPQARHLAAGKDISGLGAAGYGWFAEEKYHNTQVEIIRSREISRRVVQSLDLANHERFAQSRDRIDAFRRLIQVVPRRDTGLIEISISGSDRDEITQWVNEVARIYVDRNLEEARSRVESAIDQIRTQMERLQEDFASAQTERFESIKGSTVFTSEEKEAIIREQLKTFNAELTKVQIDKNSLQDTLQQIRALQERGADLMSLPLLAEDPTIKELYRDKVQLERERESQKVDLGPAHPDYEKTVAALNKVEQRIKDRTSVLLGTLQNRYQHAEGREDYLSRQIQAAETASLEFQMSFSDYGIRKSMAETKKAILDRIQQTMTEVQFGVALLSNNVSVLDWASPPLFPIKPRRRANLAIGAMFGMFLGIAATFFLDYLDNTFRTPEDVEKYLNLAVLGVIPRIQQDEGLANRGVKEAYQSLRTSVIFSSKNRQRKVILVTSTGPQEGKSSTVANLAQMLAAGGDRVLILDCDLRRPTQHLIHGVERDNGVTNYLSAPLDRTDWSAYTKPGVPANLHLFTCGPIPPSPPELLGSERFAQLLAGLKKQYDWVLIDSPPAASLADATLLSALSDLLVLVIHYNRTDRDLVTKALQRLRAVNDNVAGAVLNNVDLDRAYHKEYYYAGYYYYGEDGERKERKRPEQRTAKVG